MTHQTHRQSPRLSVSHRLALGVVASRTARSDLLHIRRAHGFCLPRGQWLLTTVFAISSGCSQPSSRSGPFCMSCDSRGIAWTFHAIGSRKAGTEARHSRRTSCAALRSLSFRCGLMFTSQAQMMRPTPPNQSAAANRRWNNSHAAPLSGCCPAGQPDGSGNLFATVAADRGLRSQRRHDMVSPTLALRSAHRGPAAVAELGR
jgi:hypothetical protein